MRVATHSLCTHKGFFGVLKPYKKLLNKFFITNLEKIKKGNTEQSKLIESQIPPQLIKEKSAEIIQAPGNNVFYNPVQEFNRDLSVLAVQVFSKQYQNRNGDGESLKSFRILEALSATGLRSIRYAKEVPNVTGVVTNDYSYEAYKNIELNIKHNNVEHIVEPSYSDAVELMFNCIQKKKRFQAVDIDPYGSPTQFLDTAVQCVADGGLLLVTCTDMGVLCGVNPETCSAKYGAVSLKIHGKHEMAIRIVLQTIQTHASRYKRYIVPLLSISADFYIRVIVKVNTSALACKEIFSKLAMVCSCCTCDAYALLPLGSVKKGEDGKVIKYSVPHLSEVGGKCVHCGGHQQMGGPIWSGHIHDENFVNELLNSKEIHEFGTSKRLIGMLTLIQEELHDVPLYYLPSYFCKLVKCVEMPQKILRSAILNAGYRVSNSHARENAIKTDAPVSFLWDLYRAWAKKHHGKIIPGSVGEKILQTSIQNEIDFSERSDVYPASKKMGLLRYQINPAPNWGPGRKGAQKTIQNSRKKNNSNAEEILLSKKQKTEESILEN